MTTNEAAERLPSYAAVATTILMKASTRGVPSDPQMHSDIMRALAAERAIGASEATRATVERIRERIARWPKDGAVRDFLVILDEETAR